MTGQLDVERDRVDARRALDEGHAVGALGGHEGLEAVLVRQVDQEAGEVLVVLDDDQDAVVRADGGAVVLDLGVLQHGLGRVGRVDVAHHRHDVGPRLGAGGARGARRGVDLRNVEREHAAPPGRAREANLPAEQAGDLAADGEAEAGPAVLAARASVRLLERLEDDLLLVSRDPDAGVVNGDRDHGARPIEGLEVRAPALRHRSRRGARRAPAR